MARDKIHDVTFRFRAKASDIQWFKTYCERHGVTGSFVLRDFIQSLKQKDRSFPQKAQQDRQRRGNDD
jgi:hypothetical protein